MKPAVKFFLLFQYKIYVLLRITNVTVSAELKKAYSSCLFTVIPKEVIFF
jgi:hypothetical protein